MAFIGQRRSEPLKWRQFNEISKDTISKIKYTDETWLKSSLAIYHYVKVQVRERGRERERKRERANKVIKI
jgi:hypothetical protein